jgi:glycine cleavage system regulatory protein
VIDLVLTLIGPDHPGIVDSVSEVVDAHGGNWLESRMAHLAGKFAGVLCVEVAEDRAAALEEALARLETSGLKVIVERSVPVEATRQHAMEIDLLGLDRPGLVHEISALLAAHRINVEELATDRTAAAHSGDLVFHARVNVVIPGDVDVAAVRGDLERLAGDLMVEIRLVEALGTAR